MNRDVAGIRISRELKQFENQLDQLLTAAGRLSANVTEARVHFAESPLSTQRAIVRLGTINELLIRARSKTCGVHGDLGKVAAGHVRISDDLPAELLSLQLFRTSPSRGRTGIAQPGHYPVLCTPGPFRVAAFLKGGSPERTGRSDRRSCWLWNCWGGPLCPSSFTHSIPWQWSLTLLRPSRSERSLCMHVELGRYGQLRFNFSA